MRILLLIFYGSVICSYGLNGVSRVWDAEAYLETSKYAKSLALEIIDQIAWSGKETVLDIGTGDGLNSLLIASKVPLGKVLGIDPSCEMIDFAKAHYPQERYPNLSFAIGGALDFQTEERFDIITSFTVLQLVPDQGKALESFNDLLKPGGRMYLKFPIEDGFAGTLQKTIELPQWRDRFDSFESGWYFKTKEDYIQYVLDAGLLPLRVENQMIDMWYLSRKEMSDAIRCWLPHILILQPDEQEQFLNDLFDLFLAEVPPDSDGKFHHRELLLYVEAAKEKSM